MKHFFNKLSLFSRGYCTIDEAFHMEFINFIYMAAVWELLLQEQPALFLKIFCAKRHVLPVKSVFNNVLSYYFFYHVFAEFEKISILLQDFGNLSFFFLDFLDVRSFIYQSMVFSGKKILKVTHFFIRKPKKILSSDQFIIKVDITTFFITRIYVEYFRTIKYNEYLFNRLDVYPVANQPLKIAINARWINLCFVIYYFPLRWRIFYSNFNIYRLYFSYNKRPFYIDGYYYSNFFRNFIFFSWFFVFCTLKQHMTGFRAQLKGYLSNYMVVHSYILFATDMELNDEACQGFSHVGKALFLLEELSYFDLSPSYIYTTLHSELKTFFYKQLMHTLALRNFFLFESLEDFFISTKPSLVYNIGFISYIDYMDRFFFRNFLALESYEYAKSFRFGEVMLINNTLQFCHFRDDADLRYMTNIFSRKMDLDLSLWNVLNFNVFYPIFYVFFDLTFFNEKIMLDNLAYDRNAKLASFLNSFFNLSIMDDFEGAAPFKRFKPNVVFLLNYCYILFALQDLFAYLFFVLELAVPSFYMNDLHRMLYKNMRFELYYKYKYVNRFLKFLSKNQWSYLH